VEGEGQDLGLARSGGDRLLGRVEGGEAGRAAEVPDSRGAVDGGPDQVGGPRHRPGGGRDGRYEHTRLQGIQGEPNPTVTLPPPVDG
jgi:hypothetical protein